MSLTQRPLKHPKDLCLNKKIKEKNYYFLCAIKPTISYDTFNNVIQVPLNLEIRLGNLSLQPSRADGSW